MNKNLDSTRSTASSAAIMLGGLVLMITVLAAGAAIGQVVEARAPAGAGEPERGLHAHTGLSGRAGFIMAQEAEEAPPASQPSQQEQQSGIMRASLGSSGEAGQIGGRLGGHRHLSSEERLLLRQDIRRASEEVYEQYRKAGAASAR